MTYPGGAFRSATGLIVASALCRSHHDAEDLVQETFARVLARPRVLRPGNDLSYLIQALRNTHMTGCPVAARRPALVPLPSADPVAALDVPPTVEARRVIAAIAAAPTVYRDAVIAVDLRGFSYEQATRRLRTSTATVATRLFRGRAHVATPWRPGERLSAHPPASTPVSCEGRSAFELIDR